MAHLERQLAFAWMDQGVQEFREPVETSERITRAVGVDHGAFTRTGLPLQEITCGVPYLCLPLDSRKAVDTAEGDMSALRRLRSAFPADHVGVFLFTLEATEPGVTAYSRMFAPGLGVAEDPATGSASGPLGCYLVKHGIVGEEAALKMVSWQGVRMGRPSRIHIAIETDAAGAITRVQVGGQAVVVGEGQLVVADEGTKNEELRTKNEERNEEHRNRGTEP